MVMNIHDDHPILAGSKLVESMRYAGYKNPAYALAEIVDNAYEAKAKNVEILCEDQLENASQRNSLRIHKIAIIDDGEGMSQMELWNSLTVGRGTRNARNGLGRFGMGLPYSSLSQCKRIDVYSWQNSGKTFHTYLDFDEIMNNSQRSIPPPKLKNIPDLWKNTSKILSKNSGTTVIWSKIDRCSWKMSKTIMRNSELLIGRTYRRFIHGKKLRIRMVAIPNDKRPEQDFYVKPNDPLYQMVPSSTPKPYNTEKLFALDGEKPDETFIVKDADGHDQVVKMRFAIAINKARNLGGQSAGSSDYGKHASRNLGVSVIRAGREVNLDQNLLQTYDPRERWWGAEIEFPPALDEFFGITNNKQEAINFAAMTKIFGAQSVKDQEDDVPFTEVEDVEMRKIVQKLLTRIRHMREVIKRQDEGSRSKTKDVDRRHKDRINKANERRGNEGHKSETDEQRESESEDKRKQQLAQSLKGILSEDRIEGTVKELIQEKFGVYFTKAAWNGSQFFDVGLDGGVEIIKININHSAYKNLISVVDDIPDDIDVQTAIRRLRDVQIGLSLLLASWARYEDEEPNPEQRKKIANTRFRWGEVLDEYLEQ